MTVNPDADSYNPKSPTNTPKNAKKNIENQKITKTEE